MEFTGERFVPQIDGNIKYEHLHRYALAVELAKGRSVLDIASGEGYGSALLAKRAASVIGVDIDVESVDHAQVQYGHLPNLNFLVGSCDAIPLADASIEVVTSFETIEHHDRHEEMMQEIKRVLKVDGLLIISSPNRLVYSDKPKYTNPFHVKELYYQEFLDLLNLYFHQVHIYGQKLAVTSCVTSLEPSNKQEISSFSGDVNSLSNIASSLPSPLYFVAICSNSKDLLSANLESIYLDPLDDFSMQYIELSAFQQLQLENTKLQQSLQQYQSDLNSTNQKFTESQSKLQQTCDELDHSQSELQQIYHELKQSQEVINKMELSKFWKLRNYWLNLKYLLKPTRN